MNYHMNFPSFGGRAAQDAGGGDEGNLYWDIVAEQQDLRLDELLDLGLDKRPDLSLPLVFMVRSLPLSTKSWLVCCSALHWLYCHCYNSSKSIFDMVARSSWNSFVETNWKSAAALAHGIGRIYVFFYSERKLFFFWIIDRKDATLSRVVDTKYKVQCLQHINRKPCFRFQHINIFGHTIWNFSISHRQPIICGSPHLHALIPMLMWISIWQKFQSIMSVRIITWVPIFLRENTSCNAMFHIFYIMISS